MKKIFYLLAILLVPVVLMAQPQNEKRGKIKQLKVAFLTTELNLTTDEATKFWPIYNTFDEKQTAMRQEKVKAFTKRIKEDGMDKLTEKEAESYLTQMEENEQQLFVLRKKLHSDLKPVIGSVKTLKLKKAEDDFNRKLIKQIRERKR